MNVFEKIREKLKNKHIAYLGLDNSVPYGTEMVKLFEAIKIVNQVEAEYREKKLSEHCHDCKEYDKDKHHCPRFCEVIKSTVEELKAEYNNGWIPVEERLPSKEEYLKDDGRFIVTDGNRSYQSIYDIYRRCFRTLKSRFVSQWEFEEDKCVIAWQPLPGPYKQEGE